MYNNLEKASYSPMNLKYLVEEECSLISFFCEKYNLFSDSLSWKGMFEEVDLVLEGR